MAGKPTTMIPLQKLVNSCTPMSWEMTTAARFVERIVVVLFPGSGDASSSVGFTTVEEVPSSLVAPDSNTTVCNSTHVSVAMVVDYQRRKKKLR